jgi:hypothetical protein
MIAAMESIVHEQGAGRSAVSHFTRSPITPAAQQRYSSGRPLLGRPLLCCAKALSCLLIVAG